MSAFNQAFVQQITNEAHAYYKQYDESQLIELLAEEWVRIEGESVPIRSDDNPGVQIVRRIIRRLTTNALIVTATVSSLTSDVLTYMHNSGYDLEKYRIPISIMVSITVNSILENWKDDQENDPKK
ncbi:MAG: hypothetical protein KME07_13510 [Pegethrix bostrychoides GSE-TBD4-15B]|jgi:hypothetical protein|uniref:Uncharacterized protein n=1 Tax=Pegethrix bostrychoides GSE-TBD4-15B TaxID=2839662 RepID=A0A951PBE4_9CYAN|nr:hypothetical protein [Pegethrix bostrychoides GSE-TBD4-15B]